MADENAPSRSGPLRLSLAGIVLFALAAAPPAAAAATAVAGPAPATPAGEWAVPPVVAAAALLFRERVRGQGPGTILRNGTRRRLLTRVHEAPGLTASALARDLGLSHNAALYHVRLLAGAGLVRVARRDGPRSFLHVHPVAQTPTDVARTAALELTAPAARALAECLLDAGDHGGTVPGLVTLTGLPETTVRYHLRRFQRAGLVVAAAARTHLVYVVPEGARDAVGLGLGTPPPGGRHTRTGP